MNQIKKQSMDFYRSKKLQLVLLIILGVAYILLFFSKAIRDSIVACPTLIIANIIVFLIYLIAFIFLYIDLTKYGNSLKESDAIKANAYLDDLTGMPNRYSCDLLFQMYGNEDSIKHMGCALIVIGNLVTINESVSRDAGNQAIMDFCKILEDISEDFGFVGRNGGNEFLLVIERCSAQLMEDFFKQLDLRVERYNALELNNPLEIYYKYVLNEELKANRFSDIITEVYHRLHTRPRRKK